VFNEVREKAARSSTRGKPKRGGDTTATNSATTTAASSSSSSSSSVSAVDDSTDVTEFVTVEVAGRFVATDAADYYDE
jgi:activator of HSP90 ATPase